MTSEERRIFDQLFEQLKTTQVLLNTANSQCAERDRGMQTMLARIEERMGTVERQTRYIFEGNGESIDGQLTELCLRVEAVETWRKNTQATLWKVVLLLLLPAGGAIASVGTVLVRMQALEKSVTAIKALPFLW